MNPVQLFSAATGLNTVADPVRLGFNKGVTDLGVAVNIEIDQSGRVTRRKGQTLLQSGAYHSLFRDGGDCFVCKTGALYQIGTDLSLKSIRTGMSDTKLDYAQANNKTYYTNGIQNGYVLKGVSYPWSGGAYAGPTTNSTFLPAPVGNHIEFFAGRIFVSVGKVLYWSELHRLDLFNFASSFVQFNTKVLMIKKVDNGLFVSTEKNTYFILGLNPKEYKAVGVANFPAIEWSAAIEYVDGMEIGLSNPGLCAVWASKKGAILGTPSGAIVNLNRNKVIYPEASKGFGCIVGYQYLHGLK